MTINIPYKVHVLYKKKKTHHIILRKNKIGDHDSRFQDIL